MPIDHDGPDSLSESCRTDKPTRQIVPCFMCRATFVYRGRQGGRNGRFCSMRCQNWFDAGNQPPDDPPFTLTGWRVIAGPPDIEIGNDYHAAVFGRQPIPMKRSKDGFRIDCPGCHKEFESPGLRYCSTACERRRREHRDNLALMEAVGMEPAVKRQCANPGCTASIPKWRNGRAVSLKVSCCSAACARKLKKLTDLKAGFE